MIVQLKTVPKANQYAKQKDILCMGNIKLSISSLFANGTFFGERERYRCMLSLRHLAFVITQWDPVFWIHIKALPLADRGISVLTQKLPKPQFPHLSKVGVIMPDPHEYYNE